MTPRQRVEAMKRALTQIFETGCAPDWSTPEYNYDEMLLMFRDKLNGIWFYATRAETCFAIATPDKKTMHIKNRSTFTNMLTEIAEERGWKVHKVRRLVMPKRLFGNNTYNQSSLRRLSSGDDAAVMLSPNVLTVSTDTLRILDDLPF